MNPCESSVRDYKIRLLSGEPQTEVSLTLIDILLVYIPSRSMVCTTVGVYIRVTCHLPYDMSIASSRHLTRFAVSSVATQRDWNDQR